MGRHCGWLGLWAAIAAGADWLFIPEDPPGPDWEHIMCAHLAKASKRVTRGHVARRAADIRFCALLWKPPSQAKSTGKRRLLIVVAEGAVDLNGAPIHAEAVRAAIESNVKIETRTTVLGHTQRGGTASFYDRCLVSHKPWEHLSLRLRAH